MTNRVVYTSDVHGNVAQFRAFGDYVGDVKPALAIIGGEILPKKSIVDNDYLEMQRKFARDRLPALMREIKSKSPATRLFVTTGNDDASVLDKYLGVDPATFSNIDGKRLAISVGLEAVGYSVVPITPFAIKDREKFDLTEVTPDVAAAYAKLQKGYKWNGCLSVEEGKGLDWMGGTFTNADRINSIQRDLASRLFTQDPRKTVYVVHTPPYNTPLDIADVEGEERHVGSIALRQFIEQHQPLVTLHGHIHETVDLSGQYKTQIGSTWAMSAGNHNEDSSLAVLDFDLENPAAATRLKLPCSGLGKILKRMFG